MATLQLSERVIDAAITKLKAGLAARITTINAEFADTITLGTPSSDDIYFAGVEAVPSGRTPAIIVTDGGTGDNGRFAEEGPHSLQVDLQLVVFMLDEDSLREHLARRLLRLERAVIETLWDDDPKEAIAVTVNAQTNLAFIHPARAVPGPVFNPEDDRSMLRQFRIVVFDVIKFEN